MQKNRIAVVLVLITTLLLNFACSAGESIPQKTEVIQNEEVETVEDTEVPEAAEAPRETEKPDDVEQPAGAEEPLAVCPSELETMFNSEGESEDVYNSPETENEFILVTYQIDGDKISSPNNESAIPDEFIEYQNNTELHQYLWKFFTDIVPAGQRKGIREFILFTDGAEGVIGAVDEGSTPGSWTMEIDIIDAQDLPTLATTLIHEFGHVLTLGDEQISNDTTSCTDYMTIDGCSNSDSYMNVFYNAYWVDIYEEWAETVEFSDGEVNEDQVYAFYDQYEDQFVTDYAPTGPEEDIAETWVYFIFSEKPMGDTILEQKILFFYNYPELVELRQEIRGGLCQYAEK